MTSRSATQEVDVAIVGGGLSGLAAAWRIAELAPETKVGVYERSDRSGGILETVEQHGFRIERSADSFITEQPWALDLCKRLGIEDQLLPTATAERRAYVVHRGRLVPIPDGFQIMAATRLWPIVTSPLLSLKGKLRLAYERFVPRRAAVSDDESLEEFAIRRLGREAFERLVQPLVGGIYTADAAKLSVAAALPRFFEMERQYGSISRGLAATHVARTTDTGARYSMFVSLKKGVQQLVDRIVERLPLETLHTGTEVTSIRRTAGGGWRLSAGDDRQVGCKKLILATPAHVTARLLAPIDPTVADELGAIPYAGCVLVCLGFPLQQFQQPPLGFGFVVPAIEKRKILAASLASAKFPGRAPDDHVLVRVFIGGACQPELMDLDDRQLKEIAINELQDLLHVSGQPATEQVVRWPSALPQYHVGHTARVERIERRVAAIGELALVGNAYHGLGIPHCIHTAEQAVERLLDEEDRHSFHTRSVADSTLRP